jgi:hypothetical protein
MTGVEQGEQSAVSRTDEETPAAKAIRERLEMLGMTEPDLIRQAPVDGDTLRSLRRNERNPIRKTQNRIEAALDWPDGTLSSLLKGEMGPDQVKTVRRSANVRRTADSAPELVTIELDIPLSEWLKMTELERREAVNIASAAALKRIQEIHRRAERSSE